MGHPRKCCICNATSEVSFHRFPKDSKAIQEWKHACSLEESVDVSRHFSSEDYREPKAYLIGGLMKLKPNRFPTLNLPNNLKKESDISVVANIKSECVTSSSGSSQSRFFGDRDVISNTFDNPKHAKLALRLARDKIRKEQKKNQAVAEENEALVKTIKRLKRIVKNLKKEHFLLEDEDNSIDNIESV